MTGCETKSSRYMFLFTCGTPQHSLMMATEDETQDAAFFINLHCVHFIKSSLFILEGMREAHSNLTITL